MVPSVKKSELASRTTIHKKCTKKDLISGSKSTVKKKLPKTTSRKVLHDEDEHYFIPERAFIELVRQISTDVQCDLGFESHLRWQKSGLLVLQYASELFVSHWFECLGIFSAHAKRVTVLDRDATTLISLARVFRAEPALANTQSRPLIFHDEPSPANTQSKAPTSCNSHEGTMVGELGILNNLGQKVLECDHET